MGNRISIVHLIGGLGIGGAEKIILGLYRKADRDRFDTRVVYWQDKTALLRDEERSDGRIIRLDLRRVNSPGSVLTIAGMLKRTRADILQTHLVDADLLGFFASKIARVPHWITIHSYPYPALRRHCLRYRVMSRTARRVICVSDTVKSYLASHAGIAPGRISVVHNGVDLGEFSFRGDGSSRSRLRRSLGIGEDVRVVGNVSRLIEDKGHKHLLLAIPEVLRVHPRTVFLIVGDGELDGDLRALSRELGIGDRVIFAGARNDVPDLLDIMDLFVFPTFREALGLCVLEAMAMGKAIVATNDAAIPELIEDGREGLLVPPGNPAVLGRAIVDLLSHPERARRLAGAAAERVRDFSFDRMVRRMEALYLETGPASGREMPRRMAAAT